MNIQVLLSTMHQSKIDWLDKFNLQTNAIIINQCDKNEYIKINKNFKEVEVYSYNELGVGKSRNSALIRSNADICLMADDDMRYVDGYEKIVLDAFINNPHADVILFNVAIEDAEGNINLKVKKNSKVKFYNYLKYGTVNIAFRREVIIKNNVFFSLLFGGGAKYGSGEDTLFLTECIKKGLRIYSNKEIIAEIKYRPSSWFKGYSEKYYYDKGALFAAINRRFSYLLMLQYLIRKKKNLGGNISFIEAMAFMINGIKDFNNK